MKDLFEYRELNNDEYCYQDILRDILKQNDFHTEDDVIKFAMVFSKGRLNPNLILNTLKQIKTF